MSCVKMLTKSVGVCLLACSCLCTPKMWVFWSSEREGFKTDKKIQVRAWRTAPPLAAMLTALFHSLICPLLSLVLNVLLCSFLLILKLLLFLNFMHGGVLPTYMCVSCAQRGQKRVPDVLELEFQMVARQHLGTGTQIQVLWKSRQCF